MLRRAAVFTGSLIMVLAGVALAQGFDGTFQEPQTGMSITFSQARPGELEGMLTGPNGQFPLQGETNGNTAYGVVASQQGPLGFQAQMSPDGASLQIAFFQAGPDGQPVAAGPPLTMMRAGGGMGGVSGGIGGAPGGMGGMGGTGGGMGGAPGGMGGSPGGMGGSPGGMGGSPGGMGGSPGGFGGFGGTTGGMGGSQGGMGVDWNGSFVGDNGNVVLSVQGAQGNYFGYIQVQGQQFQFQAHLDDLTLHGNFGAGYEFWADRDGRSAYLYLGGTTYVLQQQ